MVAWGQGPKYKKSWLKSLVYQINLQNVGDICVLGKSLRLLMGETSLQPCGPSSTQRWQEYKGLPDIWGFPEMEVPPNHPF